MHRFRVSAEGPVGPAVVPGRGAEQVQHAAAEVRLVAGVPLALALRGARGPVVRADASLRSNAEFGVTRHHARCQNTAARARVLVWLDACCRPSTVKCRSPVVEQPSGPRT